MGKKQYRNNIPVLESIEGKSLPHAMELEEAVLGAILLEEHCLEKIISGFGPALFYKPAHQLMAESIVEMYRDNQPIDILTLSNKLKTKGQIDEVGGAYYISQLTHRVASTASVEFHTMILKQKYLDRYLIEQCVKTQTRIFSYKDDSLNILAELQAALDDGLKGVLHYEVKGVGEINEKLIEESIEINRTGVKSGVPSGYRMIDNLTNGWQKSDLIILAGRPSMGKTAAAISMAIYPALELKKPIAVFSLEMSIKQLTGRIQSNLSGVDASRIIKKQLTMQEIQIITEKCAILKNAPIFIDDTPNISIIELRSKARKLVKEEGVEMIIVDYLQLMRSGLDIANREQEIAEISRSLKSLAKELDIPVIALSQLARAVEATGDKKPLLSHLRESGQIEQDADMVIFCYRPEYYSITTYEIDGESLNTEGLFMLIVAKHRNGSLGEIPLGFIHTQAKLIDHKDDSKWVKPVFENGEVKKFEPSNNMAQNNEFLSTGNKIDEDAPF